MSDGQMIRCGLCGNAAYEKCEHADLLIESFQELTKSVRSLNESVANIALRMTKASTPVYSSAPEYPPENCGICRSGYSPCPVHHR